MSEDKINVLSYSDYEKSVCDMGESDRRVFQFLKSFANPGDDLPSLNELVEPYGPVGINTYSYLATMKSLTGTAYDLRHSERMAGQDTIYDEKNGG